MKKLVILIGIAFTALLGTTVYNSYVTEKINNEQITLLSEQVNNLQASKQDIMDLLDLIEIQIQNDRAKIVILERDAIINANEIANLNKQILMLEKENINLNKQLVTANSLINELQITITKLQKEKLSLENTITELEYIIRDLRNQLKAAQDKIYELENHECEECQTCPPAEECQCESITEFSKNVLAGQVYKYNMTGPEGTSVADSTKPLGGGFRVVYRVGNGNGSKYVIIFHTAQIYGSSVSVVVGDRVVATVSHNFVQDSMYLFSFSSNVSLTNADFHLRDNSGRKLHSDKNIYTWSWPQIYGSITYNAFIFY